MSATGFTDNKANIGKQVILCLSFNVSCCVLNIIQDRAISYFHALSGRSNREIEGVPLSLNFAIKDLIFAPISPKPKHKLGFHAGERGKRESYDLV